MGGRKRDGLRSIAAWLKHLGPAVALIAVMTGCATRVVPPSHPLSPAAVYLCDYGVHSSLLLPSGKNQYVEYNYGDWDFAALDKTDVWHTLVALFDSHQAALGRRYLKLYPGQTIPVPPNKPHKIQAFLANQQLIERLRDKMDARYRQHIETAYLNRTSDYYFLFVKDPQHYSLWNNCNTLTGKNLRALGCEVDGQPVISDFAIVGPLFSMRP